MVILQLFLLNLSIVLSLLSKLFDLTAEHFVTISNSLCIVTLSMTIFALIMYCEHYIINATLIMSDLNKKIIVDEKK